MIADRCAKLRSTPWKTILAPLRTVDSRIHGQLFTLDICWLEDIANWSCYNEAYSALLQMFSFSNMIPLVLVLLHSSSSPSLATTAPASASCSSCFVSSTVPKLVLLDRDGVINEDVGSPGVTSADRFRLIDRAGKAIGDLKRSGCRVIVVTNQSCVGKGLLTESGLDDIHETMKELLVEQDPAAVIDRVYSCTSTKDMEDPRMKPGPGMLLEAIRDADVSPKDCVLIGDTMSDLEAAARAGVLRRILVSTGYGRSIVGRSPVPESYRVNEPGEGGRGEEKDSSTSVFLIADRIDIGDVTVSQTILQSAPRSIFPFDYTMNLDTAVSSILLRTKS